MSLLLKDLQEHERKLTEIIEHANKEREAIRTLIKGFDLRGEGIRPAQSRPKQTIREAVRQQVKAFGDERFTVNQFMEKLIEVGFRDRKAMGKLRPAISGELRKLVVAGELERNNIGTDNKAIYEYHSKNRLL